jgi:hypothetical protein
MLRARSIAADPISSESDYGFVLLYADSHLPTAHVGPACCARKHEILFALLCWLRITAEERTRKI